ncbi:fibulin-1-like [Macrobrachium rosenbergii]|uniref:fibulin-1-like n=1 Tax=Macrobrachium rosenbergii TaxID=79674 RepID=UPI0034D5F0B4
MQQRREADINECQLGLHSCETTQRCDNTIGSYACIRITGCGTGYTLNHNTGECDDNDECELGTHDCDQLGPKYQCYNIKGSFRCGKKACPPAQTLSSDGTCIELSCEPGLKPGDKTCIDIDECSEGTHQCTGNQVCANRRGGYICQCPVGYRLNNQRQCEDVNECESYFGSICANNAVCENTDGSYRCNCMAGFKQSLDSRTCVGKKIPILTNVKVVQFVKVQMSSVSTHEEDTNAIPSLAQLTIFVILNTKTSVCISVTVFLADAVPVPSATLVVVQCSIPVSKMPVILLHLLTELVPHRCKKVSLYCREDDEVCRRKPLSYSYNFLPLVSNLTLPGIGQVDLFTMRGPLWSSTTVQFELELVSARAPAGVEAATREFFHLKRTAFNQAVISLVKSIMGPQEVKLSLNMQLYHQGAYGGSAVAELLLYVSEYDF